MDEAKAHTSEQLYRKGAGDGARTIADRLIQVQRYGVVLNESVINSVAQEYIQMMGDGGTNNADEWRQ